MAEKKPKQKPSKSQISTGDKELKAVVNNTDHFRRNFYLLILALSFLFYGNTLFNGYSMDDDLVIKEHRLVKQGISAIPKIFVSRYSVNEKQSYEYRPVTLAVFAIEYQLFGEKPGVGHFINILLYALIGIVLFEVISAIFIQHHRMLPALVVFLFMIHPIHSEVVASIKNRDELLAMLFSLLSMRALLRYFSMNQHWKYLLYAFLFVLLAYLSKRSAMTLLAQLPLVVYFAISSKEGFKSSWKKLALSAGVVLIGFVVIKLFTMNVFGSGGSVRNPLFFENPLYADRLSFFERIPIALGCFWFYVQKLLIPYPLVSYYGYNAYELTGWSNLTTFLGLLIGVGFTVLAIAKRKSASPWIFGWFYLLITISMFTNIAVPAPGIVAERFAFGASVGFSVMIAWVLLQVFNTAEKTQSIPTPLRNIGIALTLICAVFVIDRNMDWKSTPSLYLADVKVVPNSAKLNSLMGTEFSNEVLGSLRGYGKKLSPQAFRQKTDSALFYFNQALTAYPDYAAVHNNIGTIYMMANEDYDKARYHFRRAVEVDTVYVQAFFNLGFQYQFDHEVYESLVVSFAALDTDTIADSNAVAELKPVNVWQLGVALQKTQRNAVSLMRQVLQSKTKEDVAAKLNSLPQNLSQSVQFNFANCGFVPKADSFANLAASRLRALFNNETSGDPEQMMKTAVVKFIGTQVADHIQKSSVPKGELSWINYLRNKEKNTRDSMFFCYNKTLELKPSMNQAYQQLNGLYRAYNMSDSVISLNTRLLNEDTYQPEQLHVYIANAYIYSNRIPQGIDHMKKAVELNDKYLAKLVTIANSMARAGNPSAAQTMTLWYNQKRKENMGICDLISSKYLETGDIAAGEQYKKLAIQYKQ